MRAYCEPRGDTYVIADVVAAERTPAPQEDILVTAGAQQSLDLP